MALAWFTLEMLPRFTLAGLRWQYEMNTQQAPDLVFTSDITSKPGVSSLAEPAGTSGMLRPGAGHYHKMAAMWEKANYKMAASHAGENHKMQGGCGPQRFPWWRQLFFPKWVFPGDTKMMFPDFFWSALYLKDLEEKLICCGRHSLCPRSKGAPGNPTGGDIRRHCTGDPWYKT